MPKQGDAASRVESALGLGTAFTQSLQLPPKLSSPLRDSLSILVPTTLLTHEISLLLCIQYDDASLRTVKTSSQCAREQPTEAQKSTLKTGLNLFVTGINLISPKMPICH